MFLKERQSDFIFKFASSPIAVNCNAAHINIMAIEKKWVVYEGDANPRPVKFYTDPQHKRGCDC